MDIPISTFKSNQSDLSIQHSSSIMEKVGRIAAIDFGRGFGLFIVLMVHLANYWGFPLLPQTPGLLDSDDSPVVKTFFSPFIILGSWASIFALLTGASTAYIMYYQINIKKANIDKRLKQSLISALVLILIHYIYVYFCIYPTFSIDGILRQGLIPASIKEGRWVAPPLSFLFIAGPLSMIAFSDLFVTLACARIWRKQNGSEQVLTQTTIYFILLGAFFIFMAEPIKSLLIPVLNSTYENHQYIIAMILTWFVGTKHCIFPFVGYAFFGGVLAMGFYRHQNNARQIQIIGFSLAAFFGFITIYDYIKNGIPELIGLYHPFFLYMMNLSLQLLVATIVLSSFDMIPMEKRKNHARYRFLVPFRRLSTVSLTLFMTEQTTAAIYTQISVLIFPKLLQSNLFLLFVWIPFYLYCWFEVIAFWEKYNFKYSVEWWLARIFGGKKEGDILNIQKNIYENSGFANREEYFIIKRTLKSSNKVNTVIDD
jgi:hypothetical protein